MDRLPQEIHEQIVYFLADESGKPGNLPVVTASRKFQVAVERLRFRYLHISSHDLDTFDQVMSSRPERRSHLVWLAVTLCPQLPSPSGMLQDSTETNFEKPSTRDEVNGSIGRSLRRLFEIIAAWSGDQNDSFQPSFALRIDNSNSGQNSKCDFSFLDLRHVTGDLPTLPCIRECKIGSSTDSRLLHPLSAADLLAKLPNASTLEWDIYSAGDWGRYFVLDQMCRDAFIMASQTASAPLKGKDIRLRLKSPSARQIDRLPQLISPLTYDPVACAVHRLTKDCTSFWYRGPVHPSLFDPPVEASSDPYWQNITELKIIASKDSPDGSWYFKHMDKQTGTPGDDPSDEPEATISQQLPPGYSMNEQETRVADAFYEHHHRPLQPSPEELMIDMDGDEYKFDREIPNTVRLSSLLRAFAKCVARMPKLQDATLRIRSRRYLIEVTVLAPQISAGEGWDAEYADAGALSKWRVYIQFGATKRYKSLPDWQPEEDVLQFLRDIGKNQSGEAVLCFLSRNKFCGRWPVPF